ncbi:hypothetical protein DFS34DRAFT_647796 [Phlyctochytrium arcticum]|nr:hypothetical protein DFS34DRAFT_647796 [Phlyctochytrium arcticum]
MTDHKHWRPVVVPPQGPWDSVEEAEHDLQYWAMHDGFSITRRRTNKNKSGSVIIAVQFKCELAAVYIQDPNEVQLRDRGTKTKMECNFFIQLCQSAHANSQFTITSAELDHDGHCPLLWRDLLDYPHARQFTHTPEIQAEIELTKVAVRI